MFNVYSVRTGGRGDVGARSWVRDISLSLISAVNAGDRTILVPSHLRSHLLSKANKVQGERRAELARAMLSRSLYSQCISKCITKLQLCSDVNPVMSSYIRMHPHLACNIFKRCKNAIEVT